MAFRRFTRSRFSRGRSSSSRFRRPFMNTVRRPVKWSRGQISLSTVHTHDDVDNVSVLTVVPIAQIQNLEDGAAAGANMAQAVRKLEIGGVKLTIHRRLLGFNQSPIEPTEINDTSLLQVFTKVVLVSDALVTEPVSGGVSPQALNTNWFTNTLPATSTPNISDEDGQFPKRIHWQDFQVFDSSIALASFMPISGGEDPDQFVYVPSQQAINLSHQSFNKRLRLRLQDDEVLALHFASIISPAAGAANEQEVGFNVNGTIWYRFVW